MSGPTIEDTDSPSLFLLVVLAGENRPALQARARRLGIVGQSRMNRKELQDAILRARFGVSLEWVTR